MSDPAYPPGAPQPQPMPAWQPGQGGPHQWDNMPQQPIPHGQAQGAPQRGPPPMPQQQFQGYGGCGGYGQMAPMAPPPPPPYPPAGQPPPQDFGKAAAVSEEACRDALIQFVSENCCYGKAPAAEHKIEKIIPSNALHYQLDSFCEARGTGYVNEPYHGQQVDGPYNGMPPQPWQVPCVADQMFMDHQKKIEVPHTATVQPCHGCDSRGFDRCWNCHGMGQNQCHSCGGDGHRHVTDAEGNSHSEACFSCGGDGRQHCHTCGGDGRITCDDCRGHRQLKCFIELTVTFVNHKEDHIIEQTDMPDELVRDVAGDTIFEQTLPQVWPINAFPVQEINQNSVRLVEKHRGNWPNERMLQQRQNLRAVSVTEVACTWKDSSFRYWVYGQQHKVHCPEYPAKSCCTIL